MVFKSPKKPLEMLVGLVAILVSARSDGHASGESGYSGQSSTCTACHSNSATPQATLSGKSTLAPGETATYSLTLSGGPGVKSGLDVSVNGGATLGTLSGEGTKLLNGEITQSSPKAFSGGQVSYSFTVTAPSSTGTFTLWGAGLSSNGFGSSGDGTGVTTLTVTVADANPCATVVCQRLDECHLVGTCNVSTGQCSNPFATDGAPCTSGVCRSGACAPSVDAGASGADSGWADSGSVADAGAGVLSDAGAGVDAGGSASDGSAASDEANLATAGCGCAATDGIVPSLLLVGSILGPCVCSRRPRRPVGARAVDPDASTQ